MVIILDNFSSIYKIKLVSGFSKLLSTKNNLLKHCLANKIRLLRQQYLRANTTNIKNMLIIDFIPKKLLYYFFSYLLILLLVMPLNNFNYILIL